MSIRAGSVADIASATGASAIIDLRAIIFFI
jgi:hypothetical protein